MDSDRHRPLPIASSLEMFVEQFHTTLERYAGRRITRRHESLVRAAMASLVGRAYRHGVLPEDGQLVVTQTSEGLAFRILCEQGTLAERFLADCARPRSRKVCRN